MSEKPHIAVLMGGWSPEREVSLVSMDGSKKLPARLFAPLSERLERNESADCILKAISGWLYFVFQKEGRLSDDPISELLNQTAMKCVDQPEDFVTETINSSAVFPDHLRTNLTVSKRLTDLFVLFHTKGAHSVLTDGAF